MDVQIGLNTIILAGVHKQSGGVLGKCSAMDVEWDGS